MLNSLQKKVKALSDSQVTAFPSIVVKRMSQDISTHGSDIQFGANSATATLINPMPVTTVVVLDDHEDSLLLISEFLKTQNIEGLLFQSARELFSVIRDLSPDMFLIDIKLPDINGFQVLDIIRQGYRIEQTPIIATTAMSDSQSQQKLRSSDFTGYLIKPFALAQMKTLLSQYLTKQTDS